MMRGQSVVVSIFIWSMISSAAGGQTIEERVEEIRRDELNSRQPMVLALPAKIPPGWTAKLIVLNTSWRSIELNFEHIEPTGEARTLSRFEVLPKQHAEIDLSPRAIKGQKEMLLRLRFFDLPGAIQAKLVVKERRLDGQLLSQDFSLAGKSRGEQVLAWPQVSSSRRPVGLTVANVSEEKAAYVLRSAKDELRIELDSWESREFEIPVKDGPVFLRYEEGGGSILASSLQWVSGSPTEVGVAERNFLDEASGFISVEIPNRSGNLDHAYLAVSNLGIEESMVPIQLLKNSSGELLAADYLEVAGLSTQTADLSTLWSWIEDWSEVRLEIGPLEDPIFPTGIVELKSDVLANLSFFRVEDAHSTGSYPVPSLDGNEVRLHLVNLSAEPTTVVAEIAWEGGAYSLEPFEIGPAAGYVVDLSSLASGGEPDLLGRGLAGNFEGGFLKWIAMQGGRDLLGRMEIRSAESDDRYGVNCFGCCWELPSGELVPKSATLTSPGITTTFQTAVKYETCSGPAGPFYYAGGTLAYSTPFSWNSKNVSASSGAGSTLSFDGKVSGTSPGCSQRLYFVDSAGLVDACKLWLISKHCENRKCSDSKPCHKQTTTCKGCNVCCVKIRAYNECKGRKKDLTLSEYNACIGLCAVNMC